MHSKPLDNLATHKSFSFYRIRGQKEKLKITKCMEINRSIFLFILISLITTHTCFLIITLNAYHIPMTCAFLNENIAFYMKDVFIAARGIYIMMIIQQMVVDFLGLYGYATLNRYVIFYFALSMLLTIWSYLILFLSAEYQEPIDRTRDNIFKNYAENGENETLVILFQKVNECCGSRHSNYDDDEIRPPSCCPDDTEVCYKNLTYKPCITTSPTFAEAIYQCVSSKFVYGLNIGLLTIKCLCFALSVHMFVCLRSLEQARREKSRNMSVARVYY